MANPRTINIRNLWDFKVGTNTYRGEVCLTFISEKHLIHFHLSISWLGRLVIPLWKALAEFKRTIKHEETKMQQPKDSDA